MPSEGVTLFLLMVNVGNSNDHPRGALHRWLVGLSPELSLPDLPESFTEGGGVFFFF